MKKTPFILLLIIFASCAGTKKVVQDFSALPMPKFTRQQAEEDFDLEVKALKEAHTGLYRYASKEQFDSIVKSQRNKIADSLNVFEFYNIVAPIVAFAKEDHCDIALPEMANDYLSVHGKFLPVEVVSLNEKVYILNDPDEKARITGHELLAVNSVAITDIYRHIFNTFAADGFVRSSKFRYLDFSGLAREYAKTVGQPESFELDTRDPGGHKQHHTVRACSFALFKSITGTLKQKGIMKGHLPPASLTFEPGIAILAVNTFSNKQYKTAGMDFKDFIRSAFDSIKAVKPKALIIDIRENGGGSEGNEDFLFSFLTGKPYNKYRYVQASGFTYSFLQYTDYSKPEDRAELEADLKEEHYLSEDGRILRKPGIESAAPLQPQPYKGDVYVLTSGWTYSGGAEFACLMREHTNALFIGEEVGGGYYGNTSGYSLELTLPNTGITTDLPLLKFVLDVSPKVPFGRGVLPDYNIQPDISQFLKGYDAEMEFARKLIHDKK
ncbi:hypothetical protein HYN59_03320 [Flavobacterium album]|uniref:Tail specific protease domain-containing protein n=1 Tax=Flavobacterium album TaxID=2175091 RepID=A0A2S1QUV1_9FLAO|nr:S41 family peptidase [Flavobacterium album]AWH84200.1 hypothetical protein HYN59_03320 [Flavobacterium album]